MMQTILNNIDSQLAHAITWTIVHSLWQGGLIALVMSVLHSKDSSSKRRYMTSVAALGLLLMSSVVTFSIYFTAPASASIDATMAISTQIMAPVGPAAIIQEVRTWFDLRSETILLVWLSGVIAFLVKIIIGLGYVHYLRSGIRHQTLSYALSKIKQRLDISNTINILASSRVGVPMVIGSLKPVILFPLGLINHLSIEEVEAVLAHELAHVLRHDFFANLIIHLVETLYYYHPAVWWISANIRAERENSCDDLALQTGVSPLLYAQTLTKIEALQARHAPTMAMALTTDKNQLLNRIKRILNMKQTKRNVKEKTVATLLMLTVALLFSTNVVSGVENSKNVLIPSIEKLPSALETVPLKSTAPTTVYLTPLQRVPHYSVQQDTTPASRSSVTIQTETNGKKMKLQKENGQITHLEIDGEVIPKSRYEEYEHLTDDVIIMGDDGGRSMFFFGDGGGFESFPRFNFDFDSENLEQGFPEDFEMPDMSKIKDLLNDMEFPDIQRFEGNSEQLEEMLEQMMGGMKDIYGDSLQMKRFELDMEDFGNNFGNLFEDTDGVFDWHGEEDHIFPPRSNSRKSVAEVLGNELNRDGLLEPFKTNQIQLTGKHLKINGDKQPKNIWGKYKRIYEENTGIPLSKKARLDFPFEGKKSDRKIRSF